MCQAYEAERALVVMLEKSRLRREFEQLKKKKTLTPAEQDRMRELVAEKLMLDER